MAADANETTWKPEDDIICLFDMDNTLFDYDGQMREDLMKLASPTELPLPQNLRENQPWLVARMELIKRQPGWWRSLPPIDSGFELVNIAKEIGYTCKILTKGPIGRDEDGVPRKTPAWTEKVECIQQHFGPSVEISIVSESKRGVYGRVLVDDWPNYMTDWLSKRPRGLGIMPAMSYNLDYCNPNVIIYEKWNKADVVGALKSAYKRASHQHWREITHGQ